MDHEQPKTRQEKKGKGSGRKEDPLYSQKRVRQLEALMERRAAAASQAASKSKGR